MTEGLTRRILTRAVKRQLNHLYTELSRIVDGGGLDFGLFCREHAYHTWLLCRLNGLPAELVLGHYFVFTPDWRRGPDGRP